STHPVTQSGWLRRDLIERMQNASGLPVEHIVVDLEQEGLPLNVTLVLSTRTSRGEELIEHLKAKAAHDGSDLFIAVVPQADGSGEAPREARERLGELVDPPAHGGAVRSRM